MSGTNLLNTLKFPQDVSGLSLSLKIKLAEELRGFLIESVNSTGGHLSSSLGVVELTIALHSVFQSPKDKIIWDVGHQSYPHKILTGRKDKMATLRQKNGISGFTKRTESEHDIFGAGHASTSISAALGMTFAMQNAGSHAIAVIGDGALTGGMAFEALNHAGVCNKKILVILNDNKMSISENVGAMSRYLGRILSSNSYSFMRELSRKTMGKKLWQFAKKTEEHVKGMVVPGTLFEEMGFHYVGPIDGHDVRALIKALRIMKKLNGPQFLHIITKKGKGHSKAELDPINYHGVASQNAKGSSHKTFTQVFGSWLCQKGELDPKIFVITPAMREGSGLVEFSKRFPDRFIDVGIAEQHAVTLAAGMATQNIKPIVAIYSTFLQRAYDQLIHDVAVQNLPVIFAIDRAGLVGADGATHAGMFDLTYLRCVPNLVVMAPAFKQEFEAMLDFCLTLKSPSAVRYPKVSCLELDLPFQIKLGQGQIVQEGENVAVLVFGDILLEALAATKELNITVVNMRFIKPLDTKLIDKLVKNHKILVTLETNVIAGGAGSAVKQYLNGEVKVYNLGLPDEFIEQGEIKELYADCGLDAKGIKKTLQKMINHD